MRRLRRLRAVPRTARLAPSPELITEGNLPDPRQPVAPRGIWEPEIAKLPGTPGRLPPRIPRWTRS
ncbi:exported hypothetical protein [Streptomyces misionensis JCM 4497]